MLELTFATQCEEAQSWALLQCSVLHFVHVSCVSPVLGRQTLPGGFEGSQTELRVNLLAVSSLLEYPPVFPEYSRQLHRAQNKLCSSPICSQLNFSSSCILWEPNQVSHSLEYSLSPWIRRWSRVQVQNIRYRVGCYVSGYIMRSMPVSRYRVLGRLCDVHWRLFPVCWIPAQAAPLSMYRVVGCDVWLHQVRWIPAYPARANEHHSLSGFCLVRHQHNHRRFIIGGSTTAWLLRFFYNKKNNHHTHISNSAYHIISTLLRVES